MGDFDSMHNEKKSINVANINLIFLQKYIIIALNFRRVKNDEDAHFWHNQQTVYAVRLFMCVRCSFLFTMINIRKIAGRPTLTCFFFLHIFFFFRSTVQNNIKTNSLAHTHKI